MRTVPGILNSMKWVTPATHAPRRESLNPPYHAGSLVALVTIPLEVRTMQSMPTGGFLAVFLYQGIGLSVPLVLGPSWALCIGNGWIRTNALWSLLTAGSRRCQLLYQLSYVPVSK